MLTIEEAIALAVYQHDGQQDKSGYPYILHPLGVMTKLRNAGFPDEYLMVAVLHDVFEDTGMTFETFAEQFEPEEQVLEALKALTKRDGESYTDFITRIRGTGMLAMVVKEADILDNLGRIEKIWDKNVKERLNKKYMAGLEQLRK